MLSFLVSSQCVPILCFVPVCYLSLVGPSALSFLVSSQCVPFFVSSQCVIFLWFNAVCYQSLFRPSVLSFFGSTQCVIIPCFVPVCPHSLFCPSVFLWLDPVCYTVCRYSYLLKKANWWIQLDGDEVNFATRTLHFRCSKNTTGSQGTTYNGPFRGFFEELKTFLAP